MSEWPTTRLDCAGREQHFYTSCVRRPSGLTPSVLLVRADAPVINIQLTQGCLHESAQVFRYLQWRMIAARCLLSDALQISTGLARISNLSALSEGGRFRAASSRDPPLAALHLKLRYEQAENLAPHFEGTRPINLIMSVPSF
jgi:hypothetical protein